MYIDPKTVVAPKTRWVLHDVICDTGEGGWSSANGMWDGTKALGIRWNGETGGSNGSPQSHGNPTWFIVPTELEKAVREAAGRLTRAKDSVRMNVSRPDGWDFGVYKVEIELVGEITRAGATSGLPIVFELPTLPNRLFRPLDGMMKYLIPPSDHGGSWQGKFLDGKWQAIVQTNGTAEETNPVPIELVRAYLEANIVHVVSGFLS